MSRVNEYLDLLLEGSYIPAHNEGEALALAKRYVDDNRDNIIRKLPRDFIFDGITIYGASVDKESSVTIVGTLPSATVSGVSTGYVMGHRAAELDKKIRISLTIEFGGGKPKNFKIGKYIEDVK